MVYFFIYYPIRFCYAKLYQRFRLLLENPLILHQTKVDNRRSQYYLKSSIVLISAIEI